jgi:tetratricopeptide (TPR) repeat protein
LSETVSDLLGERERLDALASDGVRDEATAVRSVFSWSYRSLGPDAARLFRYLGLHPGAHVSSAASAALLDEPLARTREHLRELVDAHLVEPISRGRYRFHDLLSVYAAERAGADDSPGDRQSAIRRLLHWYLHTTDHADRVLLPLHRHSELNSPGPRHGATNFATREEALTWCEAECANLVAVVRHAAEAGEYAVAAQFPRTLWSFFDLRKLWIEWVDTYRIGLEAARVVNDRDNEAWILNGLAVAYYDFERFEEVDDHHGLGFALHSLGATFNELGRLDEAVNCYRGSLEARRTIGDRQGEAMNLYCLGKVLDRMGRHAEAQAAVTQALDIFAELGAPQAVEVTNYLTRSNNASCRIRD